MPDKKFDVGLSEILIGVVLTLVLVQAFGLIFTSLNIRLGPVFVILPISIAGIMGIIIIKKLLNPEFGYTITKQDVFAIIITTVIALLVMFYLKSFVPEIFSGSIVQLQALVGL